MDENLQRSQEINEQAAQPQGKLVFALDIGTRSIIGLVGRIEEEKLHVLAIEKEVHSQRAMIDGQIENIEQVAKVAMAVKKRLESRVGCTLSRVCVAAAGRALKTQRAFYELEFSEVQHITEETICRLEAGAIEKAEEEFKDDEEGRRFYLVGYSVTQYQLDHYPMSDLKDHQGQSVRADVIATFLPSEVVESLYTTMNKIGLEVEILTLEPIAAINAAIPKNIRLLNLALVDIGAGTSDIAISRDGSVIGYTMATVAGDEISETLMKMYLIDFDTAEKIKFEIREKDKLEFHDILGVPHTISKDEVLECINDSFQSLCKEIADKIIEVNGSAPSAVFLAGGGSNLIDMEKEVAKYLGMDEGRVAIAGNNFGVNAVSDDFDLNNPEYATPLGIAVSAGLNLINDSCHVVLNGKRARLFHGGSLTAMDVLMMNGYGYQNLIGRTGKNLIIEINGKRKIFYGTHSTLAVLKVNGQDAKVSDTVRPGDTVEFSPAQNGEPAVMHLSDIVEEGFQGSVTVNGEVVSLDTLLKTGDLIEINALGEPAGGVTAVQSVTDTMTDAPDKVHVQQGAEKPQENMQEAPAVQLQMENTHLDRKQVVNFMLNGESLFLLKKEGNVPYYLMDMLEYSGIDFEKPDGVVVLKVNGEEGAFQQQLSPGDNIEIYCQKTE